MNMSISTRDAYVAGYDCLICDSHPDATFVGCPACLEEYAESETYPADCDECEGRGVVEASAPGRTNDRGAGVDHD